MLEKEPLEFCPNIVLVNDDIFHWECHIAGPQDSPYGKLFCLTCPNVIYVGP